MFDLPPIDDWVFTGQQAPGCGPCQRDRDRIVELEPDTVYSHTLASYVDVWVCPECDNTVVRGDGANQTTADGERF